MTAAGTITNAIVISGLPVAIKNSTQALGAGMVTDTGTLSYSCTVGYVTSTSVSFVGYGVGSAAGVTPNFALASGDILSFTITYEVD